VEAVERELGHDGLLLRYRPDADDVDGLPGREDAFVVRPFWMADALAGIGCEDQAVNSGTPRRPSATSVS
jgi:GH15 family glucan-1,4-alpha-glucosidase